MAPRFRLLSGIISCYCVRAICSSPGCNGNRACAAGDRLDTTSALQTVRGPASAAAAAPPPPAALAPASPTYGFYFPVYTLPAASLRVVSSVRKYYPDSPIHLIQDGGDIDFGQACKLPKYNCTFEAMAGEHVPWNPHPWLLRFYHVARRLQTDYIIFLESDVDVQGRHQIEPRHDAGGIFDSFNRKMSGATEYYVERLGRERNPCFELQWEHFGLAGGSYFRTAAILDAFSPEMVSRIDWRGLKQTEGHRTICIDFAMHVALSARGFVVYPWEEIAEGSVSDMWNCSEFKRPHAAFRHNHKEHYGDELEPEEKQLLSTPLESRGDTDCEGCVWYSGEHFETRLPVPSEPPPVTDSARAFDATKTRQDRVPPDASRCAGGLSKAR